MVSIVVPLRPGRGQNERYQWKTRQRTAKRERGAVIWAFARHALDKKAAFPQGPFDVRLVRVYVPPGRELDDDNWIGAAKAIRDQVAAQLHVNDGKKEQIRFFYAQEKGAQWAVRVEIAERYGLSIQTPVAGTPFTPALPGIGA